MKNENLNKSEIKEEMLSIADELKVFIKWNDDNPRVLSALEIKKLLQRQNDVTAILTLLAENEVSHKKVNVSPVKDQAVVLKNDLKLLQKKLQETKTIIPIIKNNNAGESEKILLSECLFMVQNWLNAFNSVESSIQNCLRLLLKRC
jgi:hypothetical protein